MAGIRDVAKHAGVSPSTVSRVLSGVAYVEPGTKNKVIRAVKELNYKPNMAARSLKKGGSKLVALIIPDIMNPYYPELVKHMEACASEAGYSLILCGSQGSVKKEAEYLETLQRLFVDGILYVSSTEYIEHVKPYIGSIPMVFVNRTFDVDAPCFSINNVEAAYQGIRYLIENGHRKISLYISYKDGQHNRDRLEGCRRAFEDYGIQDYKSYIVRDIKSEADAYQRTLELMKQKDRPTGIFLFGDFMAYGVSLGIKQSGLKIPDDISVVGFDDLPQMKYMDPPLTTIRQDMQELCDAAFENLTDQIRKQSCAAKSNVFFKGNLVVRESVKRLEQK